MKNETKSANTRQLIEATIFEIELHGLSKVTVRGISTRAGMNVASINYYFGSKADLLRRALNDAIEHMIADTKEMLQAQEDPETVLTGLLTYYLEGALKFPHLTQAILDSDRSVKDASIFSPLFAPITLILFEWLKKNVVEKETLALERRVVMFLSAAFFPGFHGGLFSGFDALKTSETRLLYIKDIVRNAFAA